MKYLSKTLVSVVVGCQLFVLASGASAKTLSVFYADTYNIGYNGGDIWIGVIGDAFDPDDFDSYVDHARDEWEEALGINTTGQDDKSDSSIEVYGGSREELERMEPNLEGRRAVAVLESTEHVGDHTYDGKRVRNYRIDKAEVYIPKDWYYSSRDYKETATHELGHALGWFGHSSDSDDVMYRNTDELYLTSRDKDHLSQNY
ncbi:matrixin family metalloprotease [Brevibacillus humidisoli]|uniref:matrixin family metalloprotease n=1 Tax=Brevibacillus humidisoli TaxID=2895522 RepID=UPI001E4FE9C3|nr:matrixin family metalloprotease [Brevibacillus humidisoli]UFJ41663.1 matrixin family metalloprotease [Brevibacillus humidisoli]